MPGESHNDPSSTSHTTFGQQIPKRDSGGFACPSHGLLIPKEGDAQNERPTGSHRLIGSFLVKEKRAIWCFAKAHIVRTYLVLRSSLLRTSVKLRAVAIWACAQLPSLKIFSSPSFLRRRPSPLRRKLQPIAESPPSPERHHQLRCLINAAPRCGWKTRKSLSAA